MTQDEQLLPEAGDLIGGRFRILEILGAGGFGTVYKAVQENIGREVALKFLTPGVAKDPINVKRFRREAFHVSQLRHPNTITLYDYGQTEDELAYMVMEFLDGIALGDWIQDHGAVEWPRAAHIYIQVLKSLSEAHRNGLVHRDLKPENIFLCEMFGEKDYVKVLDFGVAKMTLAEADEESDEEPLTRAGSIFGTPLYMAPEQACAEPITPATDVYALGLLLFEMLTGKPPVTGRNRMDVIHKQIRDPVPVLTDDLKGTAFAELIRKACEKEPDHRFEDAARLLNAFQHAVRQMQITPRPEGGTHPEISASHAVPAEVNRAYSRQQGPATRDPAADDPTALVSVPEDRLKPPGAPAQDPTKVVQVPDEKAGSTPPPVPVEELPSVEIQRLEPADDEPAPSPPARSRPRYDLPLIGRDRAFDKLTGLVRDARDDNSGQMVLIEGEGGVGKTHLLHAVLNKLSDEPFDISIAAYRRRSLPMEALREAIAGLWDVSHRDRREVDRVIRSDLRELDGFSDREIDSIVHFLRPRSTEPDSENNAETGVLYARLERLLVRLAERRPVVLALEDVQYADNTSLAFLEYLAVTVRTQSCPLVVMMTLRPEERGLNPDLGQHLHNISANVGVGFTRMKLRRLRGRALSMFLDSILPLEPRLKERIGWLSHGVPLHAIQIIRYLQDEGELIERDDLWHLKSGNPRSIELPPDLMDLMSLRIEQAVNKHHDPPRMRRLLRWLAVLGMQVPLQLLEMVLRDDDQFGDHFELDAALTALDQEAICSQSFHHNVLCVEFDNSLLRESLLDEIGEQWSSRTLHRTAAEKKIAYYRNHQTEVPLVEIADHFRRAGDTERYRDILAASGRRAMERFDLRGAQDRYRELLNLLTDRGERGNLWVEAHVALADLARRFGKFGLAEDHYRQVVESDTASGTENSRALRGFAHLMTIQSRYEQARNLYGQALDASQRGSDPAGVAKALIGLSKVHLMQGDPRAGKQVRDRLESMLSELKNPEVHGKVLFHLAEAAQRQGRLERRYDYLVRARQALEQSSDRHALSDTLIALGGSLLRPSLNEPDRLQRAEETLNEALELNKALGDRQGVADALRYLGLLDIERDAIDDARRQLNESLSIHRTLGTPYSIGAAHNALGILELRTRNYEEAERQFNAAIDTFKQMGDQIAISQPLLNKGITAINRGQFKPARTYLHEARRIKESLGTSWALFDLRNHLAIVEMWFGQFERAEQLLDETLDRVDHSGTAEDRATARSLMGLMQCFQSRLQRAALELGRARTDARELNVERLQQFCRANAAFYSLLTEAKSDYDELVGTIDDNPILGELDRTVWLALLGRMAITAAEREPNRQSVRLLRTAATLNSRFGRKELVQQLEEAAQQLENSL